MRDELMFDMLCLLIGSEHKRMAFTKTTKLSEDDVNDLRREIIRLKDKGFKHIAMSSLVNSLDFIRQKLNMIYTF